MGNGCSTSSKRKLRSHSVAEGDSHAPPGNLLTHSQPSDGEKCSDPGNIDATPPNPPRPLPKKRKKVVLVLQDGSEVEEPDVIEPIIEKPQPEKTQTGLACEEIVLLIPQALSDGTQRVTIKLCDADFKTTLDLIHETIGCKDVAQKPELSYKLSNASAKAPTFNLRVEGDWEGCLESVEQAEAGKKKGGTALSVPVMIIVPEIYLLSLCSHTSKRKAPQTVSSVGGKRGRKKAPALIDLDNDYSDDLGDDDGGDDEDLLEQEQKMLESLENTLSTCQKCGPSLYCKIDKSGQHVALSMNQRCGWAMSLALNTHGVTLHSPPKSPLFSAFHGVGSTPTSITPASQP
ncbi:hypothetical protein JAAARDRAFT_210431, partial [Jaapia argillacea MUCL 33604]